MAEACLADRRTSRDEPEPQATRVPRRHSSQFNIRRRWRPVLRIQAIAEAARC
jgi:hypothetical protein